MQIQINTDKHIDGDEGLSSHIEAVVENAVRPMKDHLTRVEVHLEDDNGDKIGSDDKRCLMESRLTIHQPVAVSHHTGSVHQAVDGVHRRCLPPHRHPRLNHQNGCRRRGQGRT